MRELVAELVGTAVLLLVGNAVVANVLLKRAKGEGSGWILINIGWGAAVFVAVLCVSEISGAHINPAVTIGLAAAGRFAWEQVPGYVVAQMLGAMMGTTLVWVLYADHYRLTDDPAAKLGTFCTGPAIPHTWRNFLSECLATFVLVFAVLQAAPAEIDWGVSANPGTSEIGLGALGALPVALVVLAIGTSLGGTTGYAINPARDLGPRIMHALLPIPGKGSSQWSYAWIPVLGPVAGGLLAAAVSAGLARL